MYNLIGQHTIFKFSSLPKINSLIKTFPLVHLCRISMTTIRKSDGNAKILREFSSYKNSSFTQPKRVRQEDKTEHKLEPMSCWTFKKGCLLVCTKYIQALNNGSFENWNMLRWHQSFIHTTTIKKNIRLHVEKWFC